jgi:DNA invertase Pin-like site-specific DNA recombinase
MAAHDLRTPIGHILSYSDFLRDEAATELAEIIVDAESAKNLGRPGIKRILDLVRGGGVDAVIVAKLDRLTRSVRNLADLLDLFQKKGVALVSVAEALDTGSAAGRLVLNIMVSVSQWEREARERVQERERRCARFDREILIRRRPWPSVQPVRCFASPARIACAFRISAGRRQCLDQ